MENLIDGCIKGKPKARKELFHRYRKMLLGICLRYSRDKSEAEDILLEGFVLIYSKIQSYSFEGSFEGWMKKIVVHTAIDYYRKNKKENAHDNIEDHYDMASESVDAFKLLSAKDILLLIQSMPSGYKMVFNLFAIEGYSHKEIAEKMKISVSTSKSQLRKARSWLIQKVSYNID